MAKTEINIDNVDLFAHNKIYDVHAMLTKRKNVDRELQKNLHNTYLEYSKLRNKRVNNIKMMNYYNRWNKRYMKEFRDALIDLDVGLHV